MDPAIINPIWTVSECAAIEHASQAKPDLVILDVAAPEMDSIKVARHLKESMLEVPIALFTMCELEKT